MLDYLQEIIDVHELSDTDMDETLVRVEALEHNLDKGLCTKEGAIEALTDFCRNIKKD